MSHLKKIYAQTDTNPNIRKDNVTEKREEEDLHPDRLINSFMHS